MKKLVSLFVLVGLTSAASAAPSYVQPDKNGGYNVTYNYTDKEKTGWYIAGRAEMNFLNWKNKYSSDYPGTDADFSSDSYSFEPVFGASLSAGRHFGYFWRGEVEAGYITQFSDSDNGFDFKLSVPYLMANAYYDFTNGLYVGGGLGLAAPTTKLDWENFVSGDGTKTSVSPMAGLMVGFTQELDDNLVLDVRYRLAGLNGTTHTRRFEYVSTEPGHAGTFTASFENKIGLILDNSISVGIRYEF